MLQVLSGLGAEEHVDILNLTPARRKSLFDVNVLLTLTNLSFFFSFVTKGEKATSPESPADNGVIAT